jgi:hypothetical protein
VFSKQDFQSYLHDASKRTLLPRKLDSPHHSSKKGEHKRSASRLPQVDSHGGLAKRSSRHIEVNHDNSAHKEPTSEQKHQKSSDLGLHRDRTNSNSPSRNRENSKQNLMGRSGLLSGSSNKKGSQEGTLPSIFKKGYERSGEELTHPSPKGSFCRNTSEVKIKRNNYQIKDFQNMDMKSASAKKEMSQKLSMLVQATSTPFFCLRTKGPVRPPSSNPQSILLNAPQNSRITEKEPHAPENSTNTRKKNEPEHDPAMITVRKKSFIQKFGKDAWNYIVDHQIKFSLDSENVRINQEKFEQMKIDALHSSRLGLTRISNTTSPPQPEASDAENSNKLSVKPEAQKLLPVSKSYNLFKKSKHHKALTLTQVLATTEKKRQEHRAENSYNPSHHPTPAINKEIVTIPYTRILGKKASFVKGAFARDCILAHSVENTISL